MYGHGGDSFSHTVRSWTEKHFPAKPGKIYQKHDELYDDDGQSFAFSKDKETVKAAINHSSKYVRAAVARMPEYAHHMVNDNEPFVRKEVAKHNPKLAEEMAHTETNFDVLHNVIRHKNAAKIVQQKLPIPNDSSKRDVTFFQNQYIHESIARTHHDLADHYVTAPNSSIRETIARQSQHIAKKLAENGEQHPSVVSTIVSRHPELSHHYYDHPENGVRLQIAKNAEHADKMLDKERDPEVLKAIAENHPHLAERVFNHPKATINTQMDAISASADLAAKHVNNPNSRIRGRILSHYGGRFAHHLANDPDPNISGPAKYLAARQAQNNRIGWNVK
jgi:hypothetical protein